MTNFTFQEHLQSYESQTDQPRLCLSCGLRPAFSKQLLQHIFVMAFFETRITTIHFLYCTSFLESIQCTAVIDEHTTG